MLSGLKGLIAFCSPSQFYYEKNLNLSEPKNVQNEKKACNLYSPDCYLS